MPIMLNAVIFSAAGSLSTRCTAAGGGFFNVINLSLGFKSLLKWLNMIFRKMIIAYFSLFGI